MLNCDALANSLEQYQKKKAKMAAWSIPITRIHFHLACFGCSKHAESNCKPLGTTATGLCTSLELHLRSQGSLSVAIVQLLWIP